MAEMPDGRTTLYGVVDFGDCVGVVPFLDDDRILLVRQYRYVQEDARWEIPTGGVKDGETLETAAQRELQEEIGYRAEQFDLDQQLLHLQVHLSRDGPPVHGQGLSPSQRPPDETEFIEIKAFPFDEALRMVIDCEIMDSMSVIAILHVGALEGRRKVA